MKTRSFFPGLAALLGASVFASAQPVITTTSGSVLRVANARIVQAPGGSYITGSLRPTFGYSAPASPHVHITVYGPNGKVLAEAVDEVNCHRLVRSHLRPLPRASYVAFVPCSPASITRVAVEEDSGHTHPVS